LICLLLCFDLFAVCETWGGSPTCQVGMIAHMPSRRTRPQGDSLPAKAPGHFGWWCTARRVPPPHCEKSRQSKYATKFKL
jgi:hypothetical protein